MTFPTPAERGHQSFAAATSYAVTLPTTKVGKWILFVDVDNLGVVSAPAGYTVLGQDNTDDTLAVIERNLDGTEGATVTITSSLSQPASVSWERITGADTAQADISTFAVAGTGAPDPPSLTPAGGAKDYLWLVSGNGGAASTYTAAPTNYTNLEKVDPVNRVVAHASRQLNAATENPGTFTRDLDDKYAAVTVAVAPTTAVSAPMFRGS